MPLGLIAFKWHLTHVAFNLILYIICLLYALMKPFYDTICELHYPAMQSLWASVTGGLPCIVNKSICLIRVRCPQISKPQALFINPQTLLIVQCSLITFVEQFVQNTVYFKVPLLKDQGSHTYFSFFVLPNEPMELISRVGSWGKKRQYRLVKHLSGTLLFCMVAHCPSVWWYSAFCCRLWSTTPD